MAVYQRGFGVYHGAVPLKHAYTRIEQAAVLRARHRAYPFDVGSARHQNAHVHTGFGRIDERLHIHARGHEISIGDPQVLRGQADDVEIEPHGVDVGRRGGEHASARAACGHSVFILITLERRHGAALRYQGVFKRGQHILHNRPLQRQAGVAPGFDAFGRLAIPSGGNAQAAHKSGVLVDNQRFAVVARKKADAGGPGGRVVRAHFCACFNQRLEKTAHMRIEAAQPVIHQRHFHAFGQLVEQNGADAAAELIGREDIHFDAHRFLRRAQSRFPSGKIFGAVEQHFDAVAVARMRAGGAAHHLLD